MRKSALFIVLIAIVISAAGVFSGCAKKDKEESIAYGTVAEVDTKKSYRRIAVILPDDTLNKWVKSGKYLSEAFEKWGFGCEVTYAQGDEHRQAEAVIKAVHENIDAIVLAACNSDSPAIIEALDHANEQNVPVVAYDSFVNNTEGIDIYIAYDPYLSGRMLAQLTQSALLYGSGGDVPAFELLAGGANDVSARYFYSGAMDVLLPLADAGKIRILSGRKGFEQTAAELANEESGRETTEQLLRNYYSGGQKLNAVLAANDSLALGAINALESAGYSSQSGFPFIVGVGAHKENVVKMKEGKQALSLFCDERVIASEIVYITDLLIGGKLPADTDNTTFFNGKTIIPAYLLEPVLLEVANHKDLLIGSSYYSYTDLNPKR